MRASNRLRRHRKMLQLLSLLTLASFAVCSSQQVREASTRLQVVEVFASPRGDDSADGRSAKTPVRHLATARDLLRRLRAGQPAAFPGRVWLLPGVYTPAETINLTAADSNAVWSGLPNSSSLGALAAQELPVISGGGPPLRWTAIGPHNSLSTCTLLTSEAAMGGRDEDFAFPQLFSDGNRVPIATAPAAALTDPTAFYRWQEATTGASATTFRFNTSIINSTAWLPAGNASTTEDLTALIFDSPWGANPRRMRSFSGTAGTVELERSLQAALSDNMFLGVKRWAVLNVQGGALGPNRYRYSSGSGKITFNFCSNSSSEPEYAVVPRLVTIMRVSAGATNISFEGVRFAHSAIPKNIPEFSYGAAQRGAVEVGPNANGVTFASAMFTQVGGNALQAMHQVSGLTVRGCVFKDVGGRGFTTTLEHTGSAQDCEKLLVTDSAFDGCGQVFMQQPYCVFVSGASGITVRHNDITNVPYSGIRVWGHFPSAAETTAAFDAGDAAVFNISANHVHDVGLSLLSDFGGIFVTTTPAHNVADCVEGYGDNYCNVLALVRGNVVHGVRHHDHGGTGIYTDESSGRTNITGNLVFNCSGWGLHLHCGWKHTVSDNLFAGNCAVPPAPFPQYQERDYAAEPWCNFHSHTTSSQGVALTRNVFDQRVAVQAGGVGRHVSIFNNASARATYGNLSNLLVNATLNANLYVCGDGSSCSHDFPGGMSLAQWQDWGGEDSRSASVTDPGYGPDPNTTLGRRRDFRLFTDRSPALRAIGFEPLALAEVGPRQEVLRLAVCRNDGGDSGRWWNGCTVEPLCL